MRAATLMTSSAGGNQGVPGRAQETPLQGSAGNMTAAWKFSSSLWLGK
jgi:hypothetical protein